jgi:hypothetical protein
LPEELFRQEEQQVQQLLRLTLQIKSQARILPEFRALVAAAEFLYRIAAATDIAEAAAAAAEASEMAERQASVDKAETVSAELRHTHDQSLRNRA